MWGIRIGNKAIHPMEMPYRKKPCLTIFEEPDRYVKVATSNNEESARIFMEYLYEMFEYAKADERN